jgi:hypothetical protein
MYTTTPVRVQAPDRRTNILESSAAGGPRGRRLAAYQEARLSTQLFGIAE